MSCPNPDCHSASESYQIPTEYDETIVIECGGCGQIWEEPNPRFIEAQKREMEEDYYNKFKRH